MRTALMLLGAIVAISAAFFIYTAFQTPSAPPRQRTTQLPLPDSMPPTTQPGGGQVAGPGEDVWVKTSDESFQFRARRYDPQQDGAVNVERPQAEIVLSGEQAQVVRIEGATGRVVMATNVVQKGEIRAPDSAAPRRGTLHDVTISLFNQSDLNKPLLVCKVNNIAFDNDTFRIATEAYTEGTREIPADQVRVEVRGDDFDFDGRGLIIRWNEVDRRLQLLEIAHGETLTIKSQDMLRALDRPGPATSARPVMLVSADPQAGALPADAPPQTERRLDPVYRATFNEVVRITRSEELLAAADQMLVDFISGSAEPVTTRREPAARSSATAPARQRSVRSPATQSSQPVVVRWSGKLRVTALEVDSPRPAAGSINVVMSGERAPVLLNHSGMKVTCASFDYRSGDDSLTVTSSKLVPMIALEGDDGTSVLTPSIVYDGTRGQATLRGASTARFPASEKPGAEPEMLRASWEKSCVMTVDRRDQQTAIDRAVLEGAVRIEHPRLTMKSESLDLAFDNTQADRKSTLRQLGADGDVECLILDDQGDRQDLRCDHLVATMAQVEGALSLRSVTADGNVIASGRDSELSAGRLTFALTPTKPAGADKRPAAAGLRAGSDFELESLQAQVHVKLKLADGQSAEADQLIAKSTPEGMTAVFLGQPAATLTDGQNTITGPNIKVTYDAQQLQVIGPGTVHFASGENPDEPAQPVQISWQSGMSLDGRANRAEMTGGVSITSDASDGSRQIASSDRLTAELADSTEPTTAPSDSPMGRKTLRAVALTGDAQLQSVLKGEDPAQIRRMHLFASDIRYDVPSRQAEAPGNGRLLMQDTRRRPNEAVASVEGGANQLLSGFRGATAFQWDRGLVLDQSTNQMTMSGSVLIVHQDDANAAQSFRLQANQVVAGFLSDGQPATQPSGELAALGPSNMRLKSLSADGDIMLSLGQIQIEAQSATYDAISELLTARGGDNRPVELFNDQGISRGSFAEIVWNARTEQIERMRQVQAQVRR